MGEGRCLPRGRARAGALGGLPTPPVVLSAGGVYSTLLLLLTPCFCSELLRSGSCTFGGGGDLFVSCCPEFVPTEHAHSYFQFLIVCILGFPGGASGKEPACQCKRHRFDP